MANLTKKINTKTNGKHVAERPVLITGGSGFIGSNLACRLLSDGRDVVLYDNLSRPFVEANARWLASEFGSRVRLVVGDTRDRKHITELVAQASAVYHFAAQVAVTTSLIDPVHDFDVNVRGTLNVLEAIRSLRSPPPLLYTSTNKVYGGLSDLPLREEVTRYVPSDPAIAAAGVSEQRPLEFHSPYGCSKGAADQYVIDYARSYGLPATVFRMSCIYGPRQFGTEDQGWVAHFLIRAQAGEPITIYGDGKQVRDLLFVEDLTQAMVLAERNIRDVAGRAFNMGGGSQQVVSLLELLDLIGELNGERPVTHFEGWRVGDQRYYVSDTASFRALTGWEPQVQVTEGVERLQRWLVTNKIAQQVRANEVSLSANAAQRAAL